MTPAGRVWFLPVVFLFFLAQTPRVAAQSQDDQPHIQPRNAPAPKPTPRPQQQPAEPGQQPEPQQEPQVPPGVQGESSSKDSQADFNAAPLAKEPGPVTPGKNTDDGTFRPYDPHRADKDVEVGNYYLRLKNYRAALERFNDALVYKPRDAEATYGLAVTQEKLDLLAQAYQNYRQYQEILPSGPRAKEVADAIKRIEPHVDVKSGSGSSDPRKAAEHDIDVGETYLSMNRFDAARERFEEAIRLAPDNALGYFRLAQSLQGLRHMEPARILYQKYLELAPHGKFAGDAKKAIADINAVAGK